MYVSYLLEKDNAMYSSPVRHPGLSHQNFVQSQGSPVQYADYVGKTRTKEKYRVVYTDHQRLELEKEFHYSRYITIRRKAELAALLGLSERQIKIWFQNRRAKERKLTKKKLQQQQQQVTGDVQAPAIQSGGPSGPTGPVPLHSGNLGTVHSVSNGNVI
uniref:homeobox protein CDX-1-like isoform X3 n=1 Tax=Myxine glutinosa TaxID=7769 RepID=UPI00358F0E22